LRSERPIVAIHAFDQERCGGVELADMEGQHAKQVSALRCGEACGVQIRDCVGVSDVVIAVEELLQGRDARWRGKRRVRQVLSSKPEAGRECRREEMDWKPRNCHASHRIPSAIIYHDGSISYAPVGDPDLFDYRVTASRTVTHLLHESVRLSPALSRARFS
jgi:hypothetical protein